MKAVTLSVNIYPCNKRNLLHKMSLVKMVTLLLLFLPIISYGAQMTDACLVQSVDDKYDRRIAIIRSINFESASNVILYSQNQPSNLNHEYKGEQVFYLGKLYIVPELLTCRILAKNQEDLEEEDLSYFVQKYVKFDKMEDILMLTDDACFNLVMPRWHLISQDSMMEGFTKYWQVLEDLGISKKVMTTLCSTTELRNDSFLGPINYKQMDVLKVGQFINTNLNWDLTTQSVAQRDAFCQWLFSKQPCMIDGKTSSSLVYPFVVMGAKNFAKKRRAVLACPVTSIVSNDDAMLGYASAPLRHLRSGKAAVPNKKDASNMTLMLVVRVVWALLQEKQPQESTESCMQLVAYIKAFHEGRTKLTYKKKTDVDVGLSLHQDFVLERDMRIFKPNTCLINLLKASAGHVLLRARLAWGGALLSEKQAFRSAVLLSTVAFPDGILWRVSGFDEKVPQELLDALIFASFEREMTTTTEMLDSPSAYSNYVTVGRYELNMLLKWVSSRPNSILHLLAPVFMKLGGHKSVFPEMKLEYKQAQPEKRKHLEPSRKRKDMPSNSIEPEKKQMTFCEAETPMVIISEPAASHEDYYFTDLVQEINLQDQSMIQLSQQEHDLMVTPPDDEIFSVFDSLSFQTIDNDRSITLFSQDEVKSGSPHSQLLSAEIKSPSFIFHSSNNE